MIKSNTTPTLERCASSYVVRSTPLVCALALAVSLTNVSAHAQAAENESEKDSGNLLEEVTVTAQKRRERAQEVPITLNVLSASELNKQGALDYRDWSERVPGMTMHEDASANRRGGPTAVIRGVAQAGGGQLNEVAAQATTSYNFGQLPIFSSNIGLFDLERIEVLKGPQGTLFGIASMGGTVRYMPAMPILNRVWGQVTADVSSIQVGGMAYDVNFALNLPLVEDKLALRLSGSRRVSEGYVDTLLLPLSLSNSADIRIDRGTAFDGRQTSGEGVIRDSNASESLGGRAMLTYKPIDRWTMTATASIQKNHQDNKQAVDYNDQSKSWVQSRFTLEPQTDELKLFSLESSFDTGIGSIEYVGGYFQRYLNETIDFTPLAPLLLNGVRPPFRSVLDIDGPGGLPADPIAAATPFPFQTTSRMVSNELRLQDDHVPLFSSSMSFNYVVGAFHMTEDREGTFIISSPLWNERRGPNTARILTQGGLISGSKGGGEYESTAFFADVTLNATDKLSISAGVRHSDSSIYTEQRSWGDVISGRALDGFTQGDDLSRPGSLTTVGPAANETIEAKAVTPRFSMKYAFNQDQMAYFNVAKGQRLPSGSPNPNYFGDISGTSGLDPSCRQIARNLGVEDDALNGTKSDTVMSYDLGFKSTWLDRRLLANVSVFYLDWSDLQSTLQLSAHNAACLAIIPANVGAVEIKGAELQLTYIPLDDVILNTSIGYTDAGVKDTILGLKDSLGQQLERGDAISNVSPWTAAFSAEYRFPTTFLANLTGGNTAAYARFDWRYRDEHLGSILGDKASLRANPIQNMFISPAYTLMNLRTGMTVGDWSGSLYVNNLANKRAVYGAFRQSWFPNTQMAGISQPRTIGLSLTRAF